MIITEEQVEKVVKAILFTDDRQESWQEKIKEKDFKKLLEQVLGIVIQ